MAMSFAKLRHVRQWLALVAIGLAVGAVLFVWLGTWGEQQADRIVAERGAPALNLKISALVSELEKQRAVRFLVARDAEVAAALEAPDAVAFAALSDKLEELREGTRASVIYIMDAQGLTVASSNAREATSFVGSNYAFRSYFRDAFDHGTAELFALGTVSRRPGLYLTERIEGPAGPLGVVAVKVEFDVQEASWQTSEGPSYVVDDRGVVLLTNVPAWRFTTDRPIDADAAEILRQSLQYGEAALTPLPIDPARIGAAAELVQWGGGQATAMRVSAPVPGQTWTLATLFPVASERSSQAGFARLAGTMALILALIAAGGLLAMRQRQARVLERARQLEDAIGLRTSELVTANRELEKALADGATASERASLLREELAQSNRLALLGQIAAGVAHEINQPLGAIRAYADNAATFIDRDAIAEAKGNMNAIAGLTERVDAITGQLRGFARKGHQDVAPTDLGETIAAALTLLRATLKTRGVAVQYLPVAGISVLAERVGLEQIIVNLVQNAVEAMAGGDDPAVTLRVEQEGDTIRVHVSDNGPGLTADAFDQLFVPFRTSKPKGLGLGLVISQDIATRLGGTLQALPPDGQGAHFVLTLRRSS